MRISGILLMLGFISVCGGIVSLLLVPYNIVHSKYPGFILIILGTFLIIAEIVTYNWFLEN